jgi:hypothetical protein
MNYISDAKVKAKRRKSKWNLLLIPTVLLSFGLIFYLSFLLMDFLHGIVYAGQSFTVTSRGIGAIMAAVGPLFGAIPVSMLLGNFIVYLVPPARRVLDSEARNVPGTSYIDSNKKLLKMAYVLVPISYGVAFIGALLPWYK